MSTNKVIELKIQDSDTTSGFVKLYANGKIALLFDSPEEYRAFAKECFKRAIEGRVTLDDIRFVRAMRDNGIPEPAINEIFQSCLVFDEVHLGGLN